jgi:hypothetical protein
MRTRQIKPGESVESLWETVSDERNSFRLFDVKGESVTCRSESEMTTSPYMFYNKANEVEDAILFPDELVSNKQSVPFREIKNGVSRIEDGILPSTLRHLAKGMEAIELGEDPMAALRAVKDQTEDSIWALPKAWVISMMRVRQDKPTGERRRLLQRTGLLVRQKHISLEERLKISDPMEIMERDRCFGK